MSTQPYRPAQWSGATDQSSMYAMIVPGTAAPQAPVTSGLSPAPDETTAFVFGVTTAPVATPDTYYVFDAVLRASHNLRLRPTENPVQTGSNMSDHAILLPALVVLEIGMSDALDAFNGNWGTTQQKSVSCFQVMKGLQQSRTLLTLATRLDQYTSMLLVGIRPVEDYKTLSGLRAELTFQQIFMGSISSTAPVSSRQDATSQNNAGSTQASGTLTAAAQQANVATTNNTSALPLVGGSTPLASFPITGSPVGL
jgi:hypothetical protein